MRKLPLLLAAGLVTTSAIDDSAELLDIARRVYPHGDKFLKHSYEHVYAQHLAPIRTQKLKFLEIGLGCNMPSIARRGDGIGLSVAFWRTYLPNAELWWAEYNAKCVERRREAILATGIRGVVTGDQADSAVLARWLNETGGMFDVIVDDGGHSTQQQWATLRGLWPGLRSGGRLIIEDMGESRNPIYRHAKASEGEQSMIGIVQQLLADLVEFSNPFTSQSNHGSSLPPSTLYSARHLPGLESIQCFAEVCVFLKAPANRRVPSVSTAIQGHSKQRRPK